MTLSVTTLTRLEELSALAPEWRGLLERAPSDVPFSRPEWMTSWWRCFQQQGALLRDELTVKVVRDAAHGRLVGVLPLMLTERPAVGPLRARALGLLGADPYITELRQPLFDPAFEVPVARALATHLLEDGRWDWITWEGLTQGSAFARTLEESMPLRWGASDTANVLSLAPSWEEFRHGLRRNIKESIRKCTNAPKRDGVELRLHVASDAGEVDEALTTFFRLHALRAGMIPGVPHPDRFADDVPRRFLREVAGRLCREGSTRVFTLLVGDRPIAARVGFLLPGCLYLYYSGFEPAYGRYSVATTLVVEAIRYAIGRGLPRLHLSMGQDVSKARWNPRLTQTHQAVWVHPRLSSRAALGAYSWGRHSTAIGRALGGLLPRRRFD